MGISLASCLLIKLRCNTSRRSWVWILVKPTPWVLIITEEKVLSLQWHEHLQNGWTITSSLMLRLFKPRLCLVTPDVKTETKKKAQGLWRFFANSVCLHRALYLIFNIHLISLHFIETLLLLLLYELKDQSSVQRMHMICFLLPIEFWTIPEHFRT